MVILSWNDGGILNSVIHESIVGGGIIIFEKAVKQIWPSLKTLLWSIGLITESLFHVLGHHLLLSGCTISLSGGITGYSNSNFIVSLWSWDIEVIFETWGLSLRSLQVSLIMALLWELNLELTHSLFNKRSLWVLGCSNSSISLHVFLFDVFHPGVLVNVWFIDHVDSLLKRWRHSHFHVELLGKNTITMLIWMDLVVHGVTVIHLDKFFGVNVVF